MSGPWEKFNKPKESSSGPWSKFKPTESSDSSEAPPEKDGSLVTGVRNFVQGATGKFSDEVAGVVEAAGKAVGIDGAGHGDIRGAKLSKEGPTIDWEILRDAYRAARDKERADLAKDKKESPVLSGVADVAGAIVSPINKVASGLSLAKGGAAIGAITGLGSSEAESVGGNLVDAGLGAAVGGTVGKVIDKASPIVKRGFEGASNRTRDMAEKFAARHQGAERGTVNKIGIDGIKKVGRQALDEKMLSGNTEKMIASNNALKSKAMDAREQAYKLVDEVAGPTFSPLSVAAKVEEKVLKGLDRKYSDTQEIIKQLEPHLENIMSRGEGNISLIEAQKLVSSLGKKAKFDSSRSNQANEIAKDVYGVVRQAINDAADDGANKIGAANIKSAIQNANRQFSTAKNAEKLLGNKLAREQGNKLIGLTDLGAGTVAGASVGGPAAVATVVGKKVAEKYGAAATAKTLDAASRLFAKNPGLAALTKSNPAIIGAITKHIGKKPPMPKIGTAEDGGSMVADAKGQDKWALDGLGKVSNSMELDEKSVEKILSSKQGKTFLAQASGLKPDSKAMGSIVQKLNKISGSDGVIEKGNIDLMNRPNVRNADGSVSTVRSMGINVDGLEVLIPTVSEDGRIMSDEEAINEFYKTGRHLGKFKNAEASTKYAERLHDDQARLIAKRGVK